MSDGADRRALDAQFPRPRLSQARALTAICLASILAPSTGWQAENRSPAPVFAASSSRLASDATWVGANGAGRTRILSRVSGVQDGLRLRGGGAWSSLAGMTSAVSNVFSAAKRSVWGTTSPLPMSPAKYNSGRDSPKRGGDESWNRGGGVKKERAMGRRWKDKRRGRGAQEAVQEADLEQAGKEEGAGPGAAGGAKGGGAQGGQKNRAGAGAPVVGQAGWEEGIEEGGAAGAKEAVQRRAPQGPRIARFSEDATIEEMLEAFPEITWDGGSLFTVKPGFVEGMRVPAAFYANRLLLRLVLEELHEAKERGGGQGGGGFQPAVRQLANVATLPGLVHMSVGMPDIHSGYGFAIGNVAAVDLADPDAVVSPGGVGFDINCGVRLIRTNLKEADLDPAMKEKLADELFRAIPVGVGQGGIIGKLTDAELDLVLRKGMEFTTLKNLSWPADQDFVEERGSFEGADPGKVSARAKARGRTQCGSLGSGNHYAEVQVVDDVFDETSAAAMGLEKGTICIMLHSGSRGLGHQVCTDALEAVSRAMAAEKRVLVDQQLACVKVSSVEGQNYLAAMRAAANFAFVNRALMTKSVRDTFGKVFGTTAQLLEMRVVYDVSHNIAKEETHVVDGKEMRVLVHRKGATRAFGPGHEEIPEKYRAIGQPVLVGGSMGTCSYVLTGTAGAMNQTFGSTCHGAGRAMSRTRAMRELDSSEVMKQVKAHGVSARVASKRLVAEEAPASYKDVSAVVDTCHAADISRKCVRLRPVICIKG